MHRMREVLSMYRQLIIGTGLLTIATITIAGDIKPNNAAGGNSYQARLRESSRLELPARAAALVREAPPSQRAAVAVQVTATAVSMAPAAASAIVAATTREAPEAASRIAPFAAHQQKDHWGGNQARRHTDQGMNNQSHHQRAPFVPGAGTPGEKHRRFPIWVHPGHGRIYCAP